MNREQIKKRLHAIRMYEFALGSSMPDEGERTDREIFKCMDARRKLEKMLKELDV